MPAFTYLSDWEVRKWSSLPDDKDCDELLQELRKLSGENWVIGRRTFQPYYDSIWKDLFYKKKPLKTIYTLYADTNGQWQVINLKVPGGGSIFQDSVDSRSDVMNFMMGYINGLQKVKNNV